eukprot:1147753-Pelagomonas_calceolata.AAC.7
MQYGTRRDASMVCHTGCIGGTQRIAHKGCNVGHVGMHQWCVIQDALMVHKGWLTEDAIWYTKDCINCFPRTCALLLQAAPRPQPI